MTRKPAKTKQQCPITLNGADCLEYVLKQDTMTLCDFEEDFYPFASRCDIKYKCPDCKRVCWEKYAGPKRARKRPIGLNARASLRQLEEPVVHECNCPDCQRKGEPEDNTRYCLACPKCGAEVKEVKRFVAKRAEKLARTSGESELTARLRSNPFNPSDTSVDVCIKDFLSERQFEGVFIIHSWHQKEPGGVWDFSFISNTPITITQLRKKGTKQ